MASACAAKAVQKSRTRVMLRVQSCGTPRAFACNHRSLHRVVKTMWCPHHVADQSPPRGRTKPTCCAALWGAGTFEGTVGLPLHVVSQMSGLPNRTFDIVQLTYSQLPKVNVTEEGSALFIHNQLSHVSLPRVNEITPRLDIFSGMEDGPSTAAPKDEHSEKECHCPAMVLQLPLPVCQRRCPREPRCLPSP